MKLCFAALMVLSFLSGFSQTVTLPDLVPGYYVVVASYVKGEESFALAYNEKLNKEGKHSLLGYDQRRKFYHVYLDQYADFNKSITAMQQARGDGFPTSWVLITKGAAVDAPVDAVTATTPISIATPPSTANENKTKPATVSTATTTAQGQAPTSEVKAPSSTTSSTPTVSAPAVESQPAASPEVAPVTAAAPVTPKVVVPEITNNDAFVHPNLLTGQTVLFTMFNPTDRTSVDGQVEIVDSENSKLLKKAKGNDSLMLPAPLSKTGKLMLIGSSFGYRPIQHELNYRSTEKDSIPNFVDVVNNQYRISFGMDKLHRGDITVLNTVYFYNDAAVMLPDSKYQLNKLLDLMVENPGYRIKLHGHTNGSAHGKIVSMGKSKSFFALTSENKQGFGSAKELSGQRAQVIKDWLVSNNVAADRIEVQAHGGSRMIHDKNGANAKSNVRVEVEML